MTKPKLLIVDPAPRGRQAPGDAFSTPGSDPGVWRDRPQAGAVKIAEESVFARSTGPGQFHEGADGGQAAVYSEILPLCPSSSVFSHLLDLKAWARFPHPSS
jgi:hypothetical protein